MLRRVTLPGVSEVGRLMTKLNEKGSLMACLVANEGASWQG